MRDTMTSPYANMNKNGVCTVGTATISEHNLSEAELLEKFNSAFYDVQQQPTKPLQVPPPQVHRYDLLDEDYFSGLPGDDALEGTDYLLDLFVPKCIAGDHTDSDGASLVTSPSDINSTFDYADFGFQFYDPVANQGSEQHRRPLGGSCTTDSLLLDDDDEDDDDIGGDFVDLDEVLVDKNATEFGFSGSLDVSDLDLCDELSNSSFDIDSISTEIYENFEQQPLPSVSTICKNNVDFNCFLRNAPDGSLTFNHSTPFDHKNSHGHLIGYNQTGSNNNNLTFVQPHPEEANPYINTNQLVLRQEDAVVFDEPMLNPGNTAEEKLQCKWEHCFEIYRNQTALVRHIEKNHVELKKGEEFTCFWLNCPRKNKPFNARYKLLIHMRVHSGEKPNKCPFRGCNKAFSRLENLKIHQRSHTGERPYLCQFANCSKSFSNSSDRAKHQRTHFDTKPYACQVIGCTKRYTDPSSLRKHVKNHTFSEQASLKKKQANDQYNTINCQQEFQQNYREHNYSHIYTSRGKLKMDLKNKISEKRRLQQAAMY